MVLHSSRYASEGDVLDGANPPAVFRFLVRNIPHPWSQHSLVAVCIPPDQQIRPEVSDSHGNNSGYDDEYPVNAFLYRIAAILDAVGRSCLPVASELQSISNIERIVCCAHTSIVST